MESSKKLYTHFVDYLIDNLPKGSTLLELGSGENSSTLSSHFKVYSIEHDPEWLNKYNTKYIHIPIAEHKHGPWYDRKIVAKVLPSHYDAVLVDGPPANIGRWPFYTYFDACGFKHDVPYVLDDVNRASEYKLATRLSKLLKTNLNIHTAGEKYFGVLNEHLFGLRS